MKDLDNPSGKRSWTVATPILAAMATMLAGGLIAAAYGRSLTPFGRSRPARADGDRQGDGQQDRFQGAGYPTEDRDDVDPKPGRGDEDVTRREDDGGTRRGEEAEGLETGDGMLEDLMTPPGGDDLGGDRDTDPNLNGGHGIRMRAPEEGPIPIEDEPTDLSVIGHGHEDKAAWNRDRVAHLQEMENDERDIRPGTSGQAGLGGAALGGVLEGWEGGNASPTIDQGDDEFDAELSEEEEVLGEMQLEDAGDVLDDDSIVDPNNTPFLPEHRDHPDPDMSIEERLLATPGEDVLSSGPEVGVLEELDMEDLNETDNIEEAWEAARSGMDDAMDGNERRGGVEDRDK